MDPNACPQCGRWLFADCTCRCGWPRANVRGKRPLVLTDRAASFIARGKDCSVLGCFDLPPAARGLWWRHYRVQLRRIPANPRKGLGCYHGLTRPVIQLQAAQKREEKQRRKQRQRNARQMLFEKGRGFMKNLSRAERVFINRVIHESHDLHSLRRSLEGAEPMRFRAFRLRWYGTQKLNWQRFDVPRMISER